MTTFAACPNDNIFGRLDTPTAGKEAFSLNKSVLNVIEGIKKGSARASAAFHDLETLAHEQGTSVQQSVIFSIAKRLLLVLPSDIPSPDLDIDSEGDVLFDWYGSGSSMLTLALRKDGRICFAARLSPMRSRNGIDQFIDSVPQEIISLVRTVTER